MFVLNLQIVPRYLPALFVCLGLIIVSSNQILGEDFFVDDSAVASDNNVGTSRDLPLRTISAAVQRAQPGDSVIVRPGDYRNEDSGYGLGVIPVTRSGTADNEIRIVGTGYARVHKFLVQNCEYVRISGFRLVNEQFEEFEGWQDMPAVVRDVPADPNNPIDFTQDYSQRSNEIEAAFATYLNIIEELKYVTGIDIVNADHIVIGQNQIDGYWSGIQCRGCRNIRILENSIFHCVNGIFAWEPGPSLTDSLIKDNRISQSLDTGIFIRRRADNVRVIDNFVTYSGINHIALDSGVTNCRVFRNDVRRGGYYSETMVFPGSSAISINGGSEGNWIIENWASYQVDLTGVDGNGIIVDLMLDGSSVQVSDNFCLRNMGSGLNITLSPNTLITDNVFLQNGFLSEFERNGAGIKLSRDGDVDNVIVRNMFINNREAGILSSMTILQQTNVNFNSYHVPNGIPLIWDGFGQNALSFRSLLEVQAITGWEKSGDSNR